MRFCENKFCYSFWRLKGWPDMTALFIFGLDVGKVTFEWSYALLSFDGWSYAPLSCKAWSYALFCHSTVGDMPNFAFNGWRYATIWKNLLNFFFVKTLSFNIPFSFYYINDTVHVFQMHKLVICSIRRYIILIYVTIIMLKKFPIIHKVCILNKIYNIQFITSFVLSFIRLRSSLFFTHYS